ncbi:MAG: hypothetical protein J0I84_11665 [Terrimonas sp.]|nr:hypothetical protein [Terrimonas sp.]
MNSATVNLMRGTYGILILALLSFTFSVKANAQKQEPILKKEMMNVSAKHSTRDVNIADSSKPFLSKNFICNVPFQNSMLPANYYANCIGFFCRKELAIEKATKIPLRFRLGSLNYCNQLEGKENSR